MNEEKGGGMSDKDLDFDELHQAVSKLMDQATKPKKRSTSAKAVAKPKETVAVTTIDDDPAPKKEPEAAKPEPPKEEKITVTVSRPPVRVAPRTRGMAMDVVQTPKPAPVAPPSARTNRMAATLQPTGPVVADTPAEPKVTPTPAATPDAAPQAEIKPDAPKAEVSDDMLAALNMLSDGAPKPKTVVEEPNPATHAAFPDPLDVHGFTDDEAKKPAESAPAMQHTAAPITPPSEAQPAKQETPEPKNVWEMPKEEPAPTTPATEAPSMSVAAPTDAATPFVNAKVEKRPLGAYAETTPPKTGTEPTSPEVGDKPQEDAKAAEREATITVPAPPKELSPEVVAVESAETEVAGADGGNSVNDLRQMAIPPQYHADEKAPSNNEHPIFDTKEYHPPLQPAAGAHKKSHIGTIITLIIVILLVIAGVGAYFVITGGLDLNGLLKMI